MNKKTVCALLAALLLITTALAGAAEANDSLMRFENSYAAAKEAAKNAIGNSTADTVEADGDDVSEDSALEPVPLPEYGSLISKESMFADLAAALMQAHMADEGYVGINILAADAPLLDGEFYIGNVIAYDEVEIGSYARGATDTLSSWKIIHSSDSSVSYDADDYLLQMETGTEFTGPDEDSDANSRSYYVCYLLADCVYTNKTSGNYVLGRMPVGYMYYSVDCAITDAQ